MINTYLYWYNDSIYVSISSLQFGDCVHSVQFPYKIIFQIIFQINFIAFDDQTRLEISIPIRRAVKPEMKRSYVKDKTRSNNK